MLLFGFCFLLDLFSYYFFFNDTATTEIYTLSLHDALPIFPKGHWTMRHYAASVGIPSGRSFARFDAFGMYTRLTARGCQDVMDWCARTATSALASEVSATSPSIPAVLRPALRCVTCRTLTSVFDRLRSISFCRFL